MPALDFTIFDTAIGACGIVCETSAPPLDEVLACTGTSTQAGAPSKGSCLQVAGLVTCNPVSGTGCTTAGSSCDRDDKGGFTCFTADQGPNTIALCGDCGVSDAYCSNGTVCVESSLNNNQCARYCCTNADCGSKGECTVGILADYPTLGVCTAK